MLLVCEWFFQIDFGDGGGNIDSGTDLQIDFSGITIEEGDIDWGISRVESPAETGNEVCWFQDWPSPSSAKQNYFLCPCMFYWKFKNTCKTWDNIPLVRHTFLLVSDLFWLPCLICRYIIDFSKLCMGKYALNSWIVFILLFISVLFLPCMKIDVYDVCRTFCLPTDLNVRY